MLLLCPLGTLKMEKRKMKSPVMKQKMVSWLQPMKPPKRMRVTEDVAGAAMAMEMESEVTEDTEEPVMDAVVMGMEMAMETADVVMTTAATLTIAVTNITTVYVMTTNMMCATSTDITSTTTIITLAVILIATTVAVDAITTAVVEDMEESEKDLLSMSPRFWHQKIIKFSTFMLTF